MYTVQNIYVHILASRLTLTGPGDSVCEWLGLQDQRHQDDELHPGGEHEDQQVSGSQSSGGCRLGLYHVVPTLFRLIVASLWSTLLARPHVVIVLILFAMADEFQPTKQRTNSPR